ncbi:S-layer homology domain-containing protein [Acutalibacter sp. 1XD8-36]|uniref:S-layer homology domain-containing protein n=1 Tax=Acutalibacter sp. 1XD8-36 TaxID=2320852 RepID=UPI001411E4AD|nr:S-layer homology domain-containing protein [Acutalibacter sp. 1XD8-36]
MKRKVKRLFALFAVCVLAVNMFAMPGYAAAENFTDVKPGAWYYTAVDYAVTEGLFSGTSATTFAPNSPMTRGMFVKVLGNKAQIDSADYPTSSFSDVKQGAWYAPCVEWAAQNGIVNGTGNGRFSPDQSVTREQMAVILYKYAEFTDCDMTVRAGMLDKFPDGGKTSGYAKYAMEWAITHGLLSGSDGKLDPQGTATRAQVARIFYNSRELLAGSGNKPVDPTPSPVPTPPPSPAPDEPRILITDEVRAKLKPNQDPEKLLDYVLYGKHDDPTFAYDGTTAKWDPALTSADDTGRKYLGSWENVEDEIRGSSAVANGFVQMLTRTASDRFYITADVADGCFCLYYHPVEVPDSQRLKEVKAALKLPDSKKLARSLCYEGAGWAGPIPLEAYGGARGVAEKIEYYLCDMHPYTTEYYITEPESGVFFLLYG